MKNDFDFIKDKFDESGVNAPESISEEKLLEKLEAVEPVKPVQHTARRVSIAAAIALVTATAIGASTLLSRVPSAPSTAETFTATLTHFKSRSEVTEAIGKAISENERIFAGRDYVVAENALDYGVAGTKSSAINDAAETASPGSSHNTTYVQETGVDEADTVKTDGNYIYYLTDNKINIFTAEGKKSKQVGSISPSAINDGEYSANPYFMDFYIYGDKLVAMENYYNYTYYYLDKGNADSDSVREGRNVPLTIAEVFDISDVNHITRTSSFSQSGNCCSSRMIGGTAYIVSSYYVSDRNSLPVVYNDYETITCGNTYESEKAATATPDELAPDCIYAVENPNTSTFMVVSSFDVDTAAKTTKTKAILGSADEIYCNTEHLFVTAREYEYKEEKTATGDEAELYSLAYYPPTTVSTQIVKVDLTNDLEFTATSKVKGCINNQYSMDEKDGYLRVATTETEDGVDSNNLFVLNSSLKKVGSVTGFAKDESIKAVRYIGDTAYVITYEETDPLFVIDTKDVTSPKILGEVKISGFSTMLVPVDENTLLGIGFHTEDEDYTDLEVQEGIKLALFDVSDKTNPKVLDEKIFKGYYSEVQYNPKALIVNYERGDYAIPYEKYDDSEDTSKYGTINFKVENKKLKVVDEYVSDKFFDNEEAYSYLERCVYVDNNIYLLGTCWDGAKDEDAAVIDAVEYK